MSQQEEARDPDAIQLESIDASQGDSLAPLPSESPPSSLARKAPPPLPPSSSLPAPRPSVAARPASERSPIFWGVVIVAMLAAGGAGGLYVANLVRAKDAPAPASSGAPLVAAASAAAPASPSATSRPTAPASAAAPDGSARTLTLPEVEIK